MLELDAYRYRPRSSEGPDTPKKSLFYTPSGFREIKKGTVLEFDATKTHAVMTQKRLDIVTVWFARR